MEDFKKMSDYELGVLAKAFAECKDCSNCACADVLCNGVGWKKRQVFILEVAERLIERR